MTKCKVRLIRCRERTDEFKCMTHDRMFIRPANEDEDFAESDPCSWVDTDDTPAPKGKAAVRVT